MSTHDRARTDAHEATEALLVEVARRYYLSYKTQSEIAGEIGVSRSQVSRYLKAAHERGIVQISIREVEGTDTDLENQIRARFPHLTEVIVVDAGAAAAAARVAASGAEMLHQLVRAGDTVSVGAGRTLARLVTTMRQDRKEGAVVVQAMGNVGHEGHAIDYNAIAQAVAAAFRARAFQINAPAILAPPYLARDMEASHPSIGGAVERARNADVFVVGLGTLDSDLLFLETGLLTQDDIDELATRRPAGDICGRFFDDQGRPIESPFDQRIVGIRLSDLRCARAVLGVAAGPDKAAPLVGALRGRYLTHLVIDGSTARALLDLTGSTPTSG